MPKASHKSHALIVSPLTPHMASLGIFVEQVSQCDSLDELFSQTITFFKTTIVSADVEILLFSSNHQKLEYRYHKSGKTGALKKETINQIPENLSLIHDALSSKRALVTFSNKENTPYTNDPKQHWVRMAIPFYHDGRLVACIHISGEKPLISEDKTLKSWADLFGQSMGLLSGKFIVAAHYEDFKARVRKVISAKVAELEAALDQAAKYNQSLKDFSYIVSHDLREPLRTINSYIKLLDRRYKNRFDGDAKDFMHFITDGVERMDSLIQGLLQFSRLENSVYHFEEVNIENIIISTCNSLNLKLVEAGAKIEYDSLPIIIGSKTHLQLIFQNLIDNAIKFRKEDQSPLIRIDFSESEKFWQFSITDNGKGMNLENKNNERIFKIFQRLQGFDSDIPGTGIGLAICKNIVLGHYGNIWVRSIPNQGSTFHFTISKILAPS